MGIKKCFSNRCFFFRIFDVYYSRLDVVKRRMFIKIKNFFCNIIKYNNVELVGSRVNSKMCCEVLDKNFYSLKM